MTQLITWMTSNSNQIVLGSGEHLANQSSSPDSPEYTHR